MKTWKRITALFLSVVLALSLTAGSVRTGAAEPKAAGACGAEGSDLAWALDADGTLTVTGSGEMADCSDATQVPWYEWRHDVRRIIVGEGVTSVGDYAFRDCAYAESVKLPEGLRRIGSCAFLNCALLRSVVIPEGTEAIGTYAFMYCDSLGAVSLPSTLRQIEHYAFDRCIGLTALTIPEGVVSIGKFAFYHSYSLRAVAFPASLNLVDEFAFSWCSGLTDVYYAGGETQWAQMQRTEGNFILDGADIRFRCDGSTPWGLVTDQGTGESVSWFLDKANGTVKLAGAVWPDSPLIAALYEDSGRMLSARLLSWPETVDLSGAASAGIFWLDAGSGTPKAESVLIDPVPERT